MEGIHVVADPVVSYLDGRGTASQNGPAFGSTVEFTLTKSFNVGPQWKLTHFTGLAPNGLIGASNKNTNTLQMAFVPASDGAKSPLGFGNSATPAGVAAQSIIDAMRVQNLHLAP